MPQLKVRNIRQFRMFQSASNTLRKRLINTNEKSNTSFLMSLRWTVDVATKKQRGAQKRRV